MDSEEEIEKIAEKLAIQEVTWFENRRLVEN